MKRTRRASGFTLIEMLLVVAILVALAGLLIPKLDGVNLKTNRGIAANNMSGINRYVQTYRVLHNNYPDGWDSLIDSGSLWTATTTAVGLNPELTGLPSSATVHTKLATTTLTSDQIVSLARIGITKIYSLGTADLPSDAFNVDPTGPITTTTLFATLNTAATPVDDDVAGIINRIYPDGLGIPSGNQLVVLGFGPRNGAIGEVVDNCPRYSNSDPTKYYCNFLCVFEVSGGADRAKLKCVLGADGDSMQGEIDDYLTK